MEGLEHHDILKMLDLAGMPVWICFDVIICNYMIHVIYIIYKAISLHSGLIALHSGLVSFDFDLQYEYKV